MLLDRLQLLGDGAREAGRRREMAEAGMRWEARERWSVRGKARIYEDVALDCCDTLFQKLIIFTSTCDTFATSICAMVPLLLTTVSFQNKTFQAGIVPIQKFKPRFEDALLCKFGFCY